jgi:uncharacterized membrane protein YedE/YeeE
MEDMIGGLVAVIAGVVLLTFRRPFSQSARLRNERLFHTQLDERIYLVGAWIVGVGWVLFGVYGILSGSGILDG